MLDRPSRIYRVLLPLLVVAFAASAVGRDQSPSEGGTYWIGASGWVAFGVLLVAAVAFTVVVVIRAVARRPKSSTVGN